MKCAIMQPTYLPWMGYFEMMLSCDCFVYFDDVQFVKKSWQQRNRIKSINGELILTVPVLKKGELEQKINEAKINNQVNWRHKHLASIEINYRKAPYFDRYIDGLRSIYGENCEKLLDFNLAIIEFLRKSFDITTPTVLSSVLDTKGDRNEHIVNICKKVGADTLYDAAGASEILDHAVFARSGVTLLFQKYQHPTYQQLHGDFLPNLSALDLLFNEGDNCREIIIARTPA